MKSCCSLAIDPRTPAQPIARAYQAPSGAEASTASTTRRRRSGCTSCVAQYTAYNPPESASRSRSSRQSFGLKDPGVASYQRSSDSVDAEVHPEVFLASDCSRVLLHPESTAG
eukprot:scaffold230729_cov26-Tisochrysis_lutea.AAC.8